MTAAVASASWGWSLPAGRSIAPRRNRVGDQAGSGKPGLTARSLVEPKALTLLLLLVLALIVAARGPITRAIGTAAPTAAPASSALVDAGQPPAGAESAPGSGALTGGAAASLHVHVHPAHNPFAARVSGHGNLLPFAVPPAGWSLRGGYVAAETGAQAAGKAHSAVAGSGSHSTAGPTSGGVQGAQSAQPSGHQPSGGAVAGVPAAANCGAHSSAYSVRAGDSLWGIVSAQMPTASNAAIVDKVDHIYRANHARIGADPSLISAGIVLCLPAS